MQRVASELEQQAGLQPSSLEAAEVFATPDSWQSCANDLNSSLAGINPSPLPFHSTILLMHGSLTVMRCSIWCAAFGYPCGLQLQSQQPEHLANTCNVLHTLLVQRQRDVSQRAQFDDHFQRMRSDLNVSEQTRDRLRSQLDAKQREHGTLQNQVSKLLCVTETELTNSCYSTVPDVLDAMTQYTA